MSKVTLHYARYYVDFTSTFRTVDGAIKAALRMADANDGYPFKIVDGDNVIWDMENKYGTSEYMNIWDFAEKWDSKHRI